MKESLVEGGPFVAAADTLAKRDLSPIYADALRAKMAAAGEGVPHRAYEIGRTALSEGIGLLVEIPVDD